jgi:hypothetical protein
MAAFRQELATARGLPAIGEAVDGRRQVPYAPNMQAPKKKATATKLRSWRATILRQRGELLGYVEAPDAKAAEAITVKQFGLEGERRKRLVVSEQG